MIPRSKSSTAVASDRSLSVEHIWDARVIMLLTHGVRYVQGTKFMKSSYRPLFVSFLKIVIL